jgi:tetratricopeptide (TPR) repeat protein
LLPSVGIVQFGVQATADRFAYLAFLPTHLSLVVLAVTGLHYVRERRMVLVVRVATVLVFLLLAQITFLQVSVWRSDLSLWAHGVRAEPDNPLAYQYLGDAFLRHGDATTAIESYEKSIDLIGPGIYMDTRSLYFGLGRAHFVLEDYDTAHAWFSRLFDKDAESFSRIGYAYYFVAEILLRKGHNAEALRYVRESLRRVPSFTRARELEAELVARP